MSNSDNDNINNLEDAPSDDDMVDYSDIDNYDEVTILEAIKHTASFIKRKDSEQKMYATKHKKPYLGEMLTKINYPYEKEFNTMAAMMMFYNLPPQFDNWFNDTITVLCDDPKATIDFPTEEWKEYIGK
jgi:glutaredoxin-related protein